MAITLIDLRFLAVGSSFSEHTAVETRPEIIKTLCEAMLACHILGTT